MSTDETGGLGWLVSGASGKKLRVIPPLALMGVIFLLSSAELSIRLPGSSDKVLHALVFGLLAALWVVALGFGTLRIGLAFLFAASWGILDEVHQAFVPGRNASWGDLLADAAGAALFTIGAALLVHWRRGRGLAEAEEET